MNQVFFDNVRVPISNIVGPENDGWKVAKYLLEFERGGSSVATRLHVDMAELKMLLDRVEGEDALKGRAKEIGIKISALANGNRHAIENCKGRKTRCRIVSHENYGKYAWTRDIYDKNGSDRELVSRTITSCC